MNIITGMLLAVSVLAASVLYTDYQSMKICELSHSRDVCFNTLYR